MFCMVKNLTRIRRTKANLMTKRRETTRIRRREKYAKTARILTPTINLRTALLPTRNYVKNKKIKINKDLYLLSEAR